MEDEIKETEMHLWGSISNKIDKISDEADRIKWDAIIDMVADAFGDGDRMDPMELFLTLYQFCFRLYYRLKSMDRPMPFNEIRKTTRLENHNDREFYMVMNYDYKMFKWALAKKFTWYMTNQWLLIPIDQLSPSEKHNFEKRVSDEG